MCTTLDSRMRTSFVFSHISRSNASCKSCFRRSCWMQASRSKGAMSRSSDRRQCAKGFSTHSSLVSTAVAFEAVGLLATGRNGTTLTFFSPFNQLVTSAYISLRPCLIVYVHPGEQPLAAFKCRTGVYSPLVSNSRWVGGQRTSSAHISAPAVIGIRTALEVCLSTRFFFFISCFLDRSHSLDAVIFVDRFPVPSVGPCLLCLGDA